MVYPVLYPKLVIPMKVVIGTTRSPINQQTEAIQANRLMAGIAPSHPVATPWTDEDGRKFFKLLS